MEVECLPLDIPEFFNVDVSALDIGDSVHIEDLAMPEGVTAIYESNLPVVSVVPPTVEEAPAAAAAPVEGAEVAAATPEAPTRKANPDRLLFPSMPHLIDEIDRRSWQSGATLRTTRHNLGFLIVDRLAMQNRIALAQGACDSIIGTGSCGGAETVLAKPQTFMNLSGWAVECLLRNFSGAADDLMVLYDDLDLPFGRIRIRPRGGAGGHRGCCRSSSDWPARRSLGSEWALAGRQ